MTAGSVPWRPSPDEELTWFRVDRGLPLRPLPLEYTCEIAAFTWGLTQALTESYWPLYQVRSRLLDGQLYLAVVPSLHAERDLENRMNLMREYALRYTRDIRAGWERAGSREVAEYSSRMTGFPPVESSRGELAEAFFHLKRARGDQWCAALRVVFCPAALVKLGFGTTAPDEAMSVVGEARQEIQRGGRELAAALERTGARLAHANCIDAATAVAWLEYEEVVAALERGNRYQATVAHRRSRAKNPSGDSPAMIGPALPTDAPRLYLLRDVLDLIGVECAG